jgi:long-subunit fatty acid transport protein
MTHTSLKIAAIILAFLFYALPVDAQSQQDSPWIFKAEGALLHQSETDLSDEDGAFAIDRWFASGGVDYAWDRRTSLGFSVGGGKSIYEFDDLTEFGGGDPWGTIKEARASLTWRFGFGETGSMIIIPTVRFNGESGASSSDSSTYGLFAATTWRINESLTIGPGIGVFSRLEDGARAFPILAIDWDISERWNLGTGRGLAASQGPGLTLSYKLNDAWSFGLAGRYEDIEFRLDDSGTEPGGVGRDQSFPLVATATLQPSQTFRLTVFAGIEFGGTLKLKNAQGITMQEVDYDPAPIFGLTVDARF